MIYAVLNYPDKTFQRWINYLPHYYKLGYLLPQEVDSIPFYNPSTQYLRAGTPIVEADKVRKTWIVVDKTADELASEAEETWINDMKTTILGSEIWTKIQNNQDLTAGEIQTVIRFLGRLILKKLF